MKRLMFATAIAAFAAAPVLAQTTSDDATSTDSMSTSSDSSMSSGSGSSSASDNGTMSGEDMVASQEKVLQVLSDAGYSNAQIMDAAYMVRAETPDGEQILMMIDTSGRVMGAQPTTGSTASGSATGSSSDMSTGSSSDTSTGSSSDMSTGSSGSSTDDSTSSN